MHLNPLKFQMSFIRFKVSGRKIFLLIGVLAGTGLSSQAATTYYWTATGTNTWQTGPGTDWSTTSTSGGTTGVAPTSADSVVFNQSTVNGTEIVQLNAATAINGMTFANTGSTTLESSSSTTETLTLGTGGITVNSGAGVVTIGNATNALNIDLSGNQSWTNGSSNVLTIQNGVTNVGTSNPYTLTVNGTKGTTFNGIISDGGGAGTTALTLSGSGTVTLVGANSYSGGTSISSGTTEIENATAFGSGTVSISGGTIDNGTSGVLTMTANNPIDINGSFTFAGTAHSLDLGAGSVLFTNNDTITANGPNGAVNLALAGNISFATTTTTLAKTGVSNLLFGHYSGVGTGTWTGASTNTLTVSGGNVLFDMANGSNIGSNIVNNSSNAGGLQGDEAAAVTNTFSGSITGTDSTDVFEQTGAGTSVLAGSVTGPIAFGSGSGGTIQLGIGTNSVSIGGLSSGAMVLPTILSGTTLAFDQTTGTTISTNISEAGTVAGVEGSNITNTLSGIISSTGGFSQTGTGTTVLANANTFSGSTSVTSGTLDLTNALALQDSTVTTGGTGIVFDSSVSGNAFTFGGLGGSANLALLNNAGTPAAISLTVGGNNASTSYTGILSGTGAALTKTGTGTLTLGSNVNSTYSGGTSVNNGVLAVGSSSAPATGTYTPFGSGTLTVNSGGTLEVGAYSSTNSSAYSYAVPINLNGGTIEADDGYERLTGTMVVSAASTLAGTFGDKGLYLDGVLSGSGNLTIANSGVDTGHSYDGTIIFVGNGNNTYSGTIGITPMSGTGSGTYLSIDSTNALADATINLSGSNSAASDVYSSSTLVFTGITSATIGGLTGSGNLILTNAAATALTLSVGNNNSGNFAYSGTASGAGGLTMVGSGTFTLSGANSYSGATTVNSGTLLLNGTGSLTGATAITVNNGGTFNESSGGVIGSAAASLSVSGGTATLAGANTYTGTTSLSSGNLNINNASALGTGSLTLSGGTIDATNGAIASQTNNPAIVLGGNFTFGGTNNLNLGTGAVTVGGSRTITLNGSGSTLTLGGTATDTVAGGATSGITTTVNGSGNTLSLGGFVLGSANTAAITDSFAGTGNVTITGAVTNGTAYANALTYSGGGTLTLAGTNTYTGATTVSSGTLVLSGNNTSANGGTSVSSGATLQLVGDANNNGATSGNTNTSIGASTALTLSAGSTLQLRDNVSDTFAPSSITTSGSGMFNFDVNNATSGTGQTLTLSGAIGFGNGNQQINVTSSGTGYTLGLGALTQNTTDFSNGSTNTGSPWSFTVNATTAAANISSFQYGSYGVNLTLEGGNNITLGGLIFNSNGPEVLTVAGANVTLNGGITQTGRNSGSFNVVLNSGTLNLANAGELSDPKGNTPIFTINGGTLDNTSGGSLTESGNPMVAVDGSFAFTGTNNLILGTGAVTVSGYDTVTVNGNTLTIGSTTLQGSGLTMAGSGNLTLGGLTPTVAGNTIANTGSGTFNIGTFSSPAAGSVDFTLGGGPIDTTGVNGSANGTIISIFATANGGADFVYESGGVIKAVGNSNEVALPTSGGSTGTIYYLTTGQTQLGAVSTAALRINDTNSDTLNVGSYGLTLGGSGGSGIMYNGGPSGQYTISGTGYVGAGTGHSFDVNTYAGTLTISAPLIDGSGNTFDSLFKGGAGTLVLTGANTFGGTSASLVVGGGTLDLGNGTAGTFTGTFPTNGISVESGATLGVGLANGSTLAATIYNFGTLVGIESSGVTNTISGEVGISSTPVTGGITQTGAGTTILSGANYYTGSTTISAGAIEITNAQGLGSAAHGTSGVTVASGAALQISGGIITTGTYTATLNGTGLASESTPMGALESISGANTYNGAITLGSNATIGADAGTLTLPSGLTNAGHLLTVKGVGSTTFSGAIGGTGGLTMSGTGTTTLSSSTGNTYTGETIVSSGELDLDSSGGFSIQGLGADTVATAPDILVNGGTLKFLATNQLANSSGSEHAR